eukprot:GHVU01106391.1.p2 GENE.GHVU01106391.1~~GHVU01106391.1.p2  ORF type:complete len:295 (-),score=74.23 GHVU01106391.1:1686-2570(-)
MSRFCNMEAEITTEAQSRVIGSLFISMDNLKGQIKDLAGQWKLRYCKNLHASAKSELEELSEQIKQTKKKLAREVTDIDVLRSIVDTLKDIRRKESEIELELEPIFEKYRILDTYLPRSVNLIDKDEQDQRTMLRSTWQKLVEQAEAQQDALSTKQDEYKKDLLSCITTFKKDVKAFKDDYDANGPMVKGVSPRSAVERLNRFKDECEVRTRKQDIYSAGEDLFGLPHQSYESLETVKKEIGYLTLLYDLYVQVVDTIKDWKEVLWVEAAEQLPQMDDKINVRMCACIILAMHV